jgi:hypothetical protein
MIRIDAMWLAVEPVDMRAGVERLLARVVQVFGAARAHHGYLFANARANRIKLLVHGVSRTRTRVRGAVTEMGEGLPESACRSWFQTAQCCCVQKTWW